MVVVLVCVMSDLQFILEMCWSCWSLNIRSIFQRPAKHKHSVEERSHRWGDKTGNKTPENRKEIKWKKTGENRWKIDGKDRTESYRKSDVTGLSFHLESYWGSGEEGLQKEKLTKRKQEQKAGGKNKQHSLLQLLSW